ncbi:ClpXP protease specificity-enhancing factor SspB [Pendulispora brunnea]|uniref:ClpXP protease specificity-enhancing factor SspB n=1 Tax=Pendulispora brunnea TaxID=2905690 RepID=A0ABZ2K7Z0_9BACT
MNPRKLMSRPLPPKKEVALALLERSSVHVHLDPRVTSVIVPPWFKSQPQLVLQIGLNMPVPIPDLHLDEDGMSCTLSFNRSPFHCVVPWASVFAMVGEDGRGMVWPDDVPVEVSRQTRPVQVAPGPKEASPDNGKAAAGAPKKGPRRIAEAAPPSDDTSAGKKKKNVVKRPRVTPAPEEWAGAPQAGAGGSRTSPQAGGPRLSAVPPVAGDGRDPLRDSSDSEPEVLGPRPPPTSRPKRELPPYLRVVK